MKQKPGLLITFSALVLILNSCAVGDKTILYGDCSPGYFVCHQFELNKDKTFEFYIFYDVGGGHVLKGNWSRFKKDTIKLNTFQQPHIPRTYYTGKVDNEFSDSIRIEIKDFEIPLGYAYVEINDGQQKGGHQ